MDVSCIHFSSAMLWWLWTACLKYHSVLFMPLNHNCTSATELELLPPPDVYHRSRGWVQTQWSSSSHRRGESGNGCWEARQKQNQGQRQNWGQDPTYIIQRTSSRAAPARGQPISIPGPRPICGAGLESSKSSTPPRSRTESPGWARMGLLGSGCVVEAPGELVRAIKAY